MCQCVLYTTQYKNELLEKIKELEYENELKYSWDMSQDGAIYKFNYVMQDIDLSEIEGFAHVIGDIIQKQGMIQVVQGYLGQRKELSQKEQKEIEKSFMLNNYLSRREGFSALTYYAIYIPILEYLKKYSALNIDGWLRFRTCQYKKVLQEILEQFTEEYLVKKDIVRFIRMVREVSYFTDSLEEVLHILYEQDGKIKILNEEMQEVTVAYIYKYCQELMTDSTLNKEDFIMHILLTVCPRKIIIHQKDKARHPEFIKTLESIFGTHIIYCQGCERCTDNTNRIKS